jgi:hypothetical protein
MPSETGITSILGVEKQLNKDQSNGYAGVDASGYVNANEIGYMSLIPIAVFVDVVMLFGPPENPPTPIYIPYIDDAPTFSNLIFVAERHYIAFDDYCFNMRKI